MKEIFVKLDYNEKKSLSYTQFIAGYIQTDSILNEDKVKSAFRIWDLDNDGVISPKEFQCFIENEFPMLKESKFLNTCIEEIKSIPEVSLTLT